MASKQKKVALGTFEVAQVGGGLVHHDDVGRVDVTAEGALVFYDVDAEMMIIYAPGQWSTVRRLPAEPQPQ